MDSQDSQKITELANNNQEPLVPNLPIVSSSDPISTPHASRRPQVPLSRFESLPTEIHIAIIAESIQFAEYQIAFQHICKLARASRVFTKIAQSGMYREIILDHEERAIRWLESDATIRREFTTQELVIGREEGGESHSVCAETVERVLAFQHSALRELWLYHVEGVKASSLYALSGQLLALVRLADADEPLPGLQALGLLSCDVHTTIDSADKPTFQLRTIETRESTFPPSFLRDIMTASASSLRKLNLNALSDDFDWTPITSGSFVQLQDFCAGTNHVPPFRSIHLSRPTKKSCCALSLV